MAWKHHIDTGAGVIDGDYRGNVGVILFNLSKEDFQGQTISLSCGPALPPYGPSTTTLWGPALPPYGAQHYHLMGPSTTTLWGPALPPYGAQHYHLMGPSTTTLWGPALPPYGAQHYHLMGPSITIYYYGHHTICYNSILLAPVE